MLERLNDVPWHCLKHAYGMAVDVPERLRQLLSPAPKVRAEAFDSLSNTLCHQGTRVPASPDVIPFLIELCAEPTVPDRGSILRFWGTLITSFFSVQERPSWGDGTDLYREGTRQPIEAEDPLTLAIHRTYEESVPGHPLLSVLLDDPNPSVRAGAAWVLACLPILAGQSVPLLADRAEGSGWVRAVHAFALGELGAAEPLRRLLAEDEFAAVRCMAACELARLEPDERLIEPLLGFVAAPIEGYENLPGAGGKLAGDAAFAISLLPPALRMQAIPAVCDRLDQARLFDTMPLVEMLLATAFPRQREPITELTNLQRSDLRRLVDTDELWSIGNLWWVFAASGLPPNRQECAALAGVRVVEDAPLAELRSALSSAQLGFFEPARAGILKALAADPAVFARTPAPAECWLLRAQAFAATDPDHARAAYRHAIALQPGIARRVDPLGRLAELLQADRPSTES